MSTTCIYCEQSVDPDTAMKGLAYEGQPESYYHSSCFMSNIRESSDRVQRGMPAAHEHTVGKK